MHRNVSSESDVMKSMKDDILSTDRKIYLGYKEMDKGVWFSFDLASDVERPEGFISIDQDARTITQVLDDFEKKQMVINQKEYTCIPESDWQHLKLCMSYLINDVGTEVDPEFLHQADRYFKAYSDNIDDEILRVYYGIEAAIGTENLSCLIKDKRTIQILKRANINIIAELCEYRIGVGGFRTIPGVGKNTQKQIIDAITGIAHEYHVTYLNSIHLGNKFFKRFLKIL